MDVEYETCNRCTNKFPDCDYFAMCDCGRKWCSEHCSESDGLREDFENDDCNTCRFCREEDHDDDVLLAVALRLLGKTREELVEFVNTGNFPKPEE